MAAQPNIRTPKPRKLLPPSSSGSSINFSHTNSRGTGGSRSHDTNLRLDDSLLNISLSSSCIDNNIPTIDLTQDDNGDAFHQESFQKRPHGLVFAVNPSLVTQTSFENLLQSTELINEINSLDSSVSTGNVS